MSVGHTVPADDVPADDGDEPARPWVLRRAQLSDADACAAIYAPQVLETATSFELDPPDGPAMAERIATSLRNHSWIVAEENSDILGYAYAGPHRARAAYRFTTEVSVYLAPQGRGRGLAAALYTRLFDELAGYGYHTAVAGITLPNEASLRLHRRLGFTEIGVFAQVGWKFDTWHDVMWMQRSLTQR